MAAKFRRVFVEITNACNLSCGFCAPSKRAPAFMTVAAFENVAAQLKPLAAMVSPHVLGEPLFHPRFAEILKACSRAGLSVNLVTNGTLLDCLTPRLVEESCLRQVSFSLHSLEFIAPEKRSEALSRIITFAKTKPEKLIVAFRLRGESLSGRKTAERVLSAFGRLDALSSEKPVTLGEKIFFHRGGLFGWPGQGTGAERKTCLGLKHHFAILATGAVVPCCMDYDGALSIGNVSEQPLAEILESPAARKMRARLSSSGKLPDFCSGCGFIPPQ